MHDPILYKAAVVRRLRDALHHEGFVEIPTPVLRRHAGDRSRPRIPAGHGRYLRECAGPALRPNLTRAERIFEIGPCFRPDQCDATHLAEFTMLDLYARGDSMEYVSALVRQLLSLFYTGRVEHLSIASIIKAEFGVDLATEPEAPLTEMLRARYGLPSDASSYDCVDKFIKTDVEHSSKGYCLFLEDFPLSHEVRAKRRAGTVAIAERFEVLIDGVEVIHAYQDEPDIEAFMARARAQHHLGREDELICEQVKRGVVPRDSAGFAIGIERLCQISYGEQLEIRAFIPSPAF